MGKKFYALLIILAVFVLMDLAPKFIANVTYFQGEPIEIEYTFNPTTGAEAYIDECYECNSSFVNIGGDTMTGTLNSQTIIPTVHNTYDLGSSAKRWQDIYTTDVYANYLKSSTGAQVIGLNTGNPIIFGNLLPSSTGTYNLGTTNYLGNSYYWKNLYMTGTLYGNNINITGNLTANFFRGEMWYHNHTATPLNFAVDGTYYNLTFDSSLVNGFTFNDAGDYLEAGHAGTYSAVYMASGSGQNNHIYFTDITVNGAVVDKCESHKKMTAGGDIVTMTGSCHLELSAGDKVRLATADVGGTGAGNYYSANLNLVRIGD